MGGPNVEWRTVPAERGGGTVTFRLSPADTSGGRALVVINKPDWMTLDDAVSPTVESVMIGDAPAQVGERLEIATTGAAPLARVTFADAENPIAPGSAVIVLDGQTSAATSAEADGNTLVAEFDLSVLGAGVYDGHIEAADRSPAANVCRIPVRVTIDGIRRHADGQTVTVCCGGDEFVVGGEGNWKSFIRLGDTGASAYLTTQIGEPHFYAYEVTDIADLPGGAGVRLTARVTDTDGQDLSEFGELEFDVAPATGFAGLLVTSRARNLHADGDVYSFWGWLPGQGFVTPDGEHEWSMTYLSLGKLGWVFLPSAKDGGTGIGLVSPHSFGESRFGTMLLYTDPTRIPTKLGDAVEIELAFVLAESADDVLEAHDRLVDDPWWPVE
ncbi:MAG TPA: hypothetical protein QGH10_26395 [Armatimonadota bacterium]|nr:hypothetical protein [Armatimonadota bacterium]